MGERWRNTFRRAVAGEEHRAIKGKGRWARGRGCEASLPLSRCWMCCWPTGCQVPQLRAVIVPVGARFEVWMGRICWRRSSIAFHRCSASSQPFNKHSPWFPSHSVFLLPSCGEVLVGDWVGVVRGHGGGGILGWWEHREPQIRSCVALYLLIHNGRGSAIMDEAGE